MLRKLSMLSQKGSKVPHAITISRHELLNTFNKVKTVNYGREEILTSMVKLCIPVIADAFCIILNSSQMHSMLHNQLKSALIQLLYKNKGDRHARLGVSLFLGFSRFFELTTS